MTTVVGQGLVGTLVGLELERRGQSFRVVDLGSGVTASRAAAGIFNPLTGPRFTATAESWEEIIPHYRNIEQLLGVSLVHPVPLVRPLQGSKANGNDFPRSAPGWSAVLCPPESQDEGPTVAIHGGGWLDIPMLLDTTRARWLRMGLLEERTFVAREGQSRKVLWCCGVGGFFDANWSSVQGVSRAWQAVRGDVLTVKVPGLGLKTTQLGKRFLLPLGNDLYRWGATHESDVADMEYRATARKQLELELAEHIRAHHFEVVDHRWGVRPASRLGRPLVVAHPGEPEWTLFNGFGGHGVSAIPRWLPRLLG